MVCKIIINHLCSAEVFVAQLWCWCGVAVVLWWCCGGFVVVLWWFGRPLTMNSKFSLVCNCVVVLLCCCGCGVIVSWGFCGGFVVVAKTIQSMFGSVKGFTVP